MELSGNIGAFREHLEKQLGLVRVIKEINFVGGTDNNVTEVCTLANNVRGILARAESISKGGITWSHTYQTIILTISTGGTTKSGLMC